MRDVTRRRSYFYEILPFLLTRPMRDVTSEYAKTEADANVSTHTPHAGRDETGLFIAALVPFLLTRPMRDVTVVVSHSHGDHAVSTHTPHAGRDRLQLIFSELRLRFYSHAPCGT